MELYGLRAKNFTGRSFLYFGIIQRNNDDWIYNYVKPLCPDYLGTYLKFVPKRNLYYKNLFLTNKHQAKKILSFLNGKTSHIKSCVMIKNHLISTQYSLNFVENETIEIFKLKL